MTKEKNREVVKIYSIEGFPFSFERLPEIARNDPEIVNDANNKMAIRIEQLSRWSKYLIDEQAHPRFFNLNIKNPEELPAF